MERGGDVLVAVPRAMRTSPPRKHSLWGLYRDEPVRVRVRVRTTGSSSCSIQKKTRRTVPLIPEGFQRSREAHPGLTWEEETTPEGLKHPRAPHQGRGSKVWTFPRRTPRTRNRSRSRSRRVRQRQPPGLLVIPHCAGPACSPIPEGFQQIAGSRSAPRAHMGNGNTPELVPDFDPVL